MMYAQSQKIGNKYNLRVPPVEQRELTHLDNPISPPDLIGVCVVQSLASCIVFCRLLYVISTFSFVHCIVLRRFTAYCYSLWYRQTFLRCLLEQIYHRMTKWSLIILSFFCIVYLYEPVSWFSNMMFYAALLHIVELWLKTVNLVTADKPFFKLEKYYIEFWLK